MTAPTSDRGLPLDGARVVITGAGGGIGAALAAALAAQGARLLLTDLDGDRVRAVAADLDVPHLAGDVTDADDVRTLVQTAHAVLGGIDLFCGNAGVAVPGSLETEAFEVSWRVNVLAHVHAARELLPGWLEAGRGRYLATVSAAGLLSMLGNAPYSVTKHAALAFAEWLRMTYAHRGITVQALCPQGVRTAMLDAADPRAAAVLQAGSLSPEDVAGAVVDGLGSDTFLILPHPEVAEYARRRATDPDRWLAGMNQAQQRLEQAFPQAVSS
jgi:NAD(P)-dependent dehydrogenase (short-subunit alcohol dehydrogenase family)